MKDKCFKHKKLFETGLKSKGEFPRRNFCEKCKSELEKLKTVEEKWEYSGDKFIPSNKIN
jgi:uncharacterized OB-fold protein